ncbi:MAG: DHH family phosphoesterase [Candidatus Dojkabacteria bacterium]
MKWILPENQDKNFVDHIYSTRKVTGDRVFFAPKTSDLSSPFVIHDMQQAADEIIKAIKDKKKIYIHGDFDVDGITATSIMWNYLHKDLGADVMPHIPNRFTDGYGLNEETIKNTIEEGGNLIISVDCGVKDIELVEKYADQVDFIITDHHTILTPSPSPLNGEGGSSQRRESGEVKGSKITGEYLISSRAKAVVHPGIQQATSNQQPVNICGAAVAWKLCQAINETLKSEVNIYKYLDLVALGTVCDIMPLIDENRSIVKLGLEQLKHTENIGLKSILKLAGVALPSVNEYTLGFVIGPRLNASGRLKSAMEAVRLLTTDSEVFADQISVKLNALNKERQDLTKQYLEIAEAKLNEQGLDKKIYFIYGEHWPEGIVGLISGKLTEKYGKPTIVGSLLSDNTIKASARSIESFHISNALKEVESLLIRYGGHSQAAGLTMDAANVDEFTIKLNEIAENLISEEDLIKKLNVDAHAKEENINVKNISTLLTLSPFGSANPLPLVILKDIDVSDMKTIGKGDAHIKMFLPDYNFEIVGFNMADKLKELLSSAKGSTLLDLAGNLDINSWNGRDTAQFKIVDMRVSE